MEGNEKRMKWNKRKGGEKGMEGKGEKNTVNGERKERKEMRRGRIERKG